MGLLTCLCTRRGVCEPLAKAPRSGERSSSSFSPELFLQGFFFAAHAWPGCQACRAVIKPPRLAPVQQIQVVGFQFGIFISLLLAKAERAAATDVAGPVPPCAMGRPSWLPK